MLSNLIPAQITKQNAALDPLASFGQQRMTGGLPDFNAMKDFSTGTVAQNSAPARGSLIRGMARSGMSSGDPASTGLLSDFNATRARAYDTNFMDLLKQNEAAKQAGASNLAAVGAARNPFPALSLYGQAAYS